MITRLRMCQWTLAKMLDELNSSNFDQAGIVEYLEALHRAKYLADEDMLRLCTMVADFVVESRDFLLKWEPFTTDQLERLTEVGMCL